MLNEVVIDRGMKPQLCNLQVRPLVCCRTGCVPEQQWGQAACRFGRLLAVPSQPPQWWLGAIPYRSSCRMRAPHTVVPIGIACSDARLQCYVDQNHVTVVQGDGLIVATPTGERCLRRLACQQQRQLHCKPSPQQCKPRTSSCKVRKALCTFASLRLRRLHGVQPGGGRRHGAPRRALLSVHAHLPPLAVVAPAGAARARGTARQGGLPVGMLHAGAAPASFGSLVLPKHVLCVGVG